MEEKENIGALFDRIAHTYDKLNHLLSLNIDKRWRQRAIHKLKPCKEALDVATGTADFAIEILRQHKAQHVTGIDLSEKMMQIGKQKAEKKKLAGKITFERANALALPYKNNQFTIVTCAYGVRNFANLDKGLHEMLRVLQPNGQLLILEFSYPENRFFRPLYDLYFNHIMPSIGHQISHDKEAYTYLNQSVKSFLRGEAMMQKLSNIGFKEVHSQTFTFGITTIYTATK